MANNTLTIQQLRERSCDTEGCDCNDELIFHSNCHPQDPTWVMWVPPHTLVVSCAACDQLICELDLREEEQIECDLHDGGLCDFCDPNDPMGFGEEKEFWKAMSEGTWARNEGA